MTHPWFTGVATPRVLAHRGLVTPDAARGGVVENSFAAVAAAHSAGAHYVESDCHLTADGVVVLFHDDDLSRVTGDPRKVADVRVRELEELMTGRGGLITLAQALDAFPVTRFNLDVKATAAASIVGRTVAPFGDRVLLTSFSDARRRAALDAAAESGRGVRPATSAGRGTIGRVLAAVASRSDRLVTRALAGIDALQVPERQGRLRIVTPRLIAAAHRHDVEVHVWTVNEPHDMTRLVSMGVDGIVTDRADVALSALT
ncbi:glycerophosphodiester phosphodiesterase family protein [Microbacterium sp. QXD-8]|uniref:Glycerophosphodiester phosphodiesterase family protein n=1 Tax=Microbacterium psychrotolerans TaxID=3068321 RepID=A0ABU0YZY0_9MICO|nr:glycerophosphodiester phosphodiesterase family protein [Microbacterium sp. QXD-8]MDQ7877888.1 glycerophosphodiester phosphodiesterase family protein [Microbacterium sp. QXD-8]